jgi:hypothetical protein
MKKAQLIEILNKIEGNPDILFYNGYVDDYMDLDKDLVKIRLVKQTFKYWKRCVENELRLSNNDFNFKLSDDKIKEMKIKYRKFQWEENMHVLDEEIRDKKYGAKTVFYLQAKPRGATDVTHGMSLSY